MSTLQSIFRYDFFAIKDKKASLIGHSYGEMGGGQKRPTQSTRKWSSWKVMTDGDIVWSRTLSQTSQENCARYAGKIKTLPETRSSLKE